MKYNIWRILEQDPCIISKISDECGISKVLSCLLYNRCIFDTEEAKHFLQPDIYQLQDPFLMPDMHLAVSIIQKALSEQKRITVYGDYDVDGITSTAILYLFLKSKGADIHYYIPDRFDDGYGMNMDAIQKIHEEGTQLIITVDNGITALDEVEYIRSLGMDIVITDHHQCREELPRANAVTNPKRPDSKYPFSDFAGVGVVFKLLCALEFASGTDDMQKATKAILDQYSEFVAIGTIADVMPLKDENRFLVKYGLEQIKNTKNIGLFTLLCRIENHEADVHIKDIELSNRKLNSSFIGYTLAPRINAAGRIGDVRKAIELFLADNFESADKLALELLSFNQIRQATESKILSEALLQLQETPSLADDAVIVLSNGHWHHGVIGIVAAKICDRYHKPTILISFSDCGDVGRGSGRSVSSFNLADALEYCKNDLVKYGGHDQAAGLSICCDKVDSFRRKINEYAASILQNEEIKSECIIDCELNPEDVTLQNISSLSLLEPFGNNNKLPIFLLRGLYIENICGVGSNKHLKITLRYGNMRLTAMYFGISPQDFPYYCGQKVDIIAHLEINHYRNTDSVQLNIVDIRSATESNSNIYDRIENIKNGKTALFDPCEVPQRSDFAAIYRFIQRQMRLTEKNPYTVLISELLQTGCITYEKAAIVLEVLDEMGIWSYHRINSDMIAIDALYNGIKIELGQSNILSRVIQSLNKKD